MPWTIPRWSRIWICLLGRGWEDRDSPQPCFSSAPAACIPLLSPLQPYCMILLTFPCNRIFSHSCPSQSRLLRLQSPSQLPRKFPGFKETESLSSPAQTLSWPFPPVMSFLPATGLPRPYDWLSGYRQRPPSCPTARQLQEPRARVLALSSQSQRALSLLSLVSLPRAPTAAARGTPLSTTCARAPWCAGHVGSLPTRLPVAQEPRWADPSPLALLPPVSQSLEATAVWGAVGVAASGTA